ncbi:FHA domain-containing protein [Pigmentiphaga sp.]|uniref:FHA domain-containing protein n=1 Tax=Pigmentiphaga sp. TaxID=1977564 RepID=UPI0025FDC604|nr:FHA domain-containing protein [Pigmentiphaga sp.]
MQELRILSGYHRGATLPLDGAALAIGADEDADVVLADPGIAARHARLSREDGIWVLTPAGGMVRGQDSNAALEQVRLADGAFGRAGAIWLAVCDSGAPWQDPPADPVDTPSQQDDEGGEGGLGASPFMDGDAEGAPARPDTFPAPHIPAVTAGPLPPASRALGFRMALVPVAVMAVLSAAAAYALTSQPAAFGEQDLAGDAAQARRLSAMPSQLAPDELRAALRKRLGEVDLLGRVVLDLRDREWTLRGALNDDDAERLQRMLRAFSELYVIDFPIHVKIGSAEAMLPFRIVQVLSGNDPSIVIDDGRRLYVGDEHRGVRLAAVAGNQLKFTGRQTLNIAW